MKNDGGPAFPTHPDSPVSPAGWLGLSLRDYFAAHAPAAPQWWWDSYKTVWTADLAKAAQHEAQWRFVYADAMLAERAEE